MRTTFTAAPPSTAPAQTVAVTGANGLDFDAFFAAHYGDVVRALTLVFGERGAAEDAAQDAFAKAYRRWTGVAAMERPSAWVYVVALRGGRRRLGRLAREPRLRSASGGDVGVDPAEQVDARLTVAEGLAGLTQCQRSAVVLRYLADLSVAEVADALGCSLGTAKATLHQSLARMRVGLEDPDLEPGSPGAGTGPRKG